MSSSAALTVAARILLWRPSQPPPLRCPVSRVNTRHGSAQGRCKIDNLEKVLMKLSLNLKPLELECFSALSVPILLMESVYIFGEIHRAWVGV